MRLSAPALADSLDRVNLAQRKVEVRLGPPADTAGWTRCSDLLTTAGAFDRWRAELAGWLTDRYGEAPDRVTAGYVMYWYLSVPGYLSALLFHHERRVPGLRPEDLSFRMAESRPHPVEIAVHSPGFVCLPDDPAADDPNACVVANQHALAAVLRGRFVAHAARFVAAFGRTVRFGRHTLWGVATDALDDGLWLAGRYGGDEDAGVADAAILLAERYPPLTSATTLHKTEDEFGIPHWTRRRESCCFHYVLAAGRGPCQTCPRIVPKQ